MKKESKVFLFAAGGYCLLLSTGVTAQDKPAPGSGEQGFREDMPRKEEKMLLKAPDLSGDNMPMPKLWGGMADPKTGQWLLFYDSERKLRVDFERGEITNMRTGEVYKRQPKTESGTAQKPKSPKAEAIEL